MGMGGLPWHMWAVATLALPLLAAVLCEATKRGDSMRLKKYTHSWGLRMYFDTKLGRGCDR